jgi:hypothetical protein
MQSHLPVRSPTLIGVKTYHNFEQICMEQSELRLQLRSHLGHVVPTKGTVYQSLPHDRKLRSLDASSKSTNN